MSDERGPDRLLEHEYDGIQEYDNPMPGWWLLLFLVTILFSILYWLNVPGIGTGKGRIASYEAEMARARAQYGDRARAAAPGLTDAQLAALAREPAKVAQGKAIFESSCSPCHRADGGGVIGPNLTDDYWIHGGRPTQILHTITTGVADKGMPAWGTVLKPDDLPVVAAFVLSLHDTHPPGPKEPQGVKDESEAAEPGRE